MFFLNFLFLRYPDVHCMVYHAKTQTLTTFYSDRSVYHWFIENDNDGNGIVKVSSQYFHAGPLFDVVVCFCTKF